jgi:V8-like Glu-specific endopeptidase
VIASSPPATAVSYQVSVAARRDTLRYWTPSRRAAATDTNADTGSDADADAGSGSGPRAGTVTTQSAPTATAPPGIPTAAQFSGSPAAGALFYSSGAGRHFCTASVVDSTGKDLVITAAHCVYSASHGYTQHIEFVPDYDDGHEPYGAWTVTTITLARKWTQAQDANDDFAFLTVSPARGDTPVQARTGGLTLGVRVPYAERDVEVIGYNDADSAPVGCTVATFEYRRRQREFYCRDYQDGTSGAPWILDYDARDGTGTLIGVTGGYQSGGNYDWASYSAYFGRAIEQLLRQAEGVPTTPMRSQARTAAAPSSRISRAPDVYSTLVPYISPSGSASSSRRTPSGSLK